jgi:exopolysaccharide biosynthesis protein
MPAKKKHLPFGLALLFDLILIAAYVLGFYMIQYKIPRQLQAAQSESSAASTSDAQTTDGEETDVTTSEESASADVATDWAVKFADQFTDEVVSTANSYSSPDISVTVTQVTEGTGSATVTYYIADIYIADIECFQTAFADDTYGVGYTETVLAMDESAGAVLAMNGDYYGSSESGTVIRNGEIYRTADSDADVCVLYYDGTMKTFSADAFDAQQAIADGAYQAWCFGPELLDDSGGSLTSFNTSRHVAEINPRSAIGYYEPGHYCLVVVDGRDTGYSRGMTLTELSSLFEELGCASAYNLDGGKSSVMTFDDAVVNQPSDGGREVSDCLLIGEVS